MSKAFGAEELSSNGGDENISIGRLLGLLWAGRGRLLGGTIFAGVVGLGVAFVLPPIFTARAVLLPPQQPQSSAASALSSLGALAGLAGGGVLKSPADQYVSFMQSYVVMDAIIDKFMLDGVYKVKFKDDARKRLQENTVINVGKKDGLITIEVDDESPTRAADIANAYVAGLRTLTNSLAISEAQQRRVFFEQQLSESKNRLTKAQIALQGSGIGPGALKSEPKAAAEGYARIRAEVTAAEIRLQALRRNLSDGSPEVAQQLGVLSGLRAELGRLEQQRPEGGSEPATADYVTKYREYKYQETLFELFARQYEVARLDESREGALIQLVDVATPPERKSKPKRSLVVGTFSFFGLFATILWILIGDRRPMKNSPAQ